MASAEFLKQHCQVSSGVFGYHDLFQSLCKQGHIDKALGMLSYVDELCDVPSDQLFWALLKASLENRDLRHAQRVHVFMVQHGMDVFGALGEYLVTVLVKCGSLIDALRVFNMLPQTTVVSWTIVIAGFVDCNKCYEALTVFEHMQHNNVHPNEYTFVALLRACASTFDLDKGKDLHADVRGLGFDSNIFVASTLVTMYGKCGSVSDAEDVFGGLLKHDLVSWTAMLCVYVEQGQGEKSIRLYRQMQEEAISLDDQSYVISVQGCDKLFQEKCSAKPQEFLLAQRMSLEIGRAIHADFKKAGVASNNFMGSSLVSMYGKLGSISEGEHVFCRLSQQSTVLWNALLSAYVEQNLEEKALLLYCQMKKKFVQPDERSFAILLQACCMLVEKDEAFVVTNESTKTTHLEIGQALYADAQKEGFGLDVVICSTLVCLYGKCGSLAGAEEVFQGLLECDVALWNVMLSAYADAGQAGKALQLCKHLQVEGMIPNEATLVRILQACSETSSIEICKQSHLTLLSSGRDLSPLMANTLVHAYGSCASMVQAREVFDGLLQPDIVSWNALMAGYAREGDSVASMQIFEEMQLANVEPDGYTFLSVLSAFCHAGLIDNGAACFNFMWSNCASTLENKHFVGIVDLLGRAGDFKKIQDILWKTQLQPDLATWLCLLRACRTHGNVELGIHVLNAAVCLQSRMTQC